ncbi:hypothetical protein ABZ302_43440, partial [Streptomyces sp. NPDC006237]|uniref:hypothetical protein n=1 Tax=Streptomyces sp. NPDC006237 TaxID=3154474 RepID=UPI0033B2A522
HVGCGADGDGLVQRVLEGDDDLADVPTPFQVSATSTFSARQADVLILREQLTLREVGEKIGVKSARVDQIAKGK